MGSVKVLLGFVSALLVVSYGNCGRILGFFPYSGYSHFVVFQALMEELANKGHDVTVVSFFPHKNPPQRYRDISLQGLQSIRMHVIDLKSFQPPTWLKPYSEFNFLSNLGLEDCDSILPSDQIKSIMNSQGLYDLVIIEQFSTDCFLPVVNKLQVPVVAVSSCGAMPWSYPRFGNPTDPAYIPSIMTANADKMNLIQRIENMIFKFITSNAYYFMYQRPAEQLVEKHLGEKVNLDAMARNLSLLFINTHFSLHQPRPHLPGVIEIGGIHVKPAKALQGELAEFVNGAEHGVVVFSLGSMVDVRSMDQEKISAFLKVFGSLRQRVIWKIEGNFDNVPSNVLILSWLPQRDVLAHGNVKAFITHGGLLGMTEAVMSGTPIVAIPIFGDQPYNVRAAVQSGVAVQLDYQRISEQTIRESLDIVLSEKYQQRSKELAEIYQDRVVPVKDLAVYWIEYVLRHGGAPLRSAAVDLSWIEYYMIDALAITISTVIFITYLLYILTRLILKIFSNKQKID